MKNIKLLWNLSYTYVHLHTYVGGVTLLCGPSTVGNCSPDAGAQWQQQCC